MGDQARSKETGTEASNWANGPVGGGGAPKSKAHWTRKGKKEDLTLLGLGVCERQGEHWEQQFPVEKGRGGDGKEREKGSS